MLKRILSPLASLKLTVVLLALSMLLIYAGTWAQVDTGSWQVQKQYFHNLFIWINFQTLVPRKYHVGGGFPMLGGYLLGALLLVNLIAAHTVRFKLTWKRAGVIMIHSAMIALLLGEGISANMAVESRMSIEEGQGAVYSQDIRTSELAVTDTSPKDHDEVTVIPADRIAKGGLIHDAKLPFDINIDTFLPNSTILGPQQVATAKTTKVTAGVAGGMGAKSIPRVNGLGGEVDFPSAYVTPVVNGKPAGTYLLTTRPLPDQFTPINEPQSVKVGDKTYLVQLRFKRIYRPYTIYLDKFSFDRYSGTDVAKNFSSDVRIVDPTRHTDRQVRIWMNHPLRYGGETFYQSGWNEATEKGTVLQIVSNPGWLLPYLACGIGALGLLVHFGMRLVTFIRKETKLSKHSGGIPVATLAPGGRAGERKPGGGRAAREPKPADPGPWITRPGVYAPALVVALALVYVISHMMPHGDNGAYNVREFASLPVSFEGRVQPFDSLARNSLRVLSGRETLAVAGSDKRMSAAQWLLDVIGQPEKAENYEIFRIDHPDLISLLQLDPHKKLFALKDLRPHGDKLMEQWKLARDTASSDRDLFQRKVIDLSAKIGLYTRIARLDKLLTFTELLGEVTELRGQERSGVAIDKKKMERAMDETMQLMDELNQSRPDPKRQEGQDPILAVPPIMGANKWHLLDEAVIDHLPSGGFEPAAKPLLNVLQEYRGSNADAFNAQVASYESAVSKLPSSDIVAFEVFFNRFDPFTLSMVLYVGAFVLICVSWLVAAGSRGNAVFEQPGGAITAYQPLYRSAVGLILLSLVIHTFGLIARIVISGHPPVTNLSSSAIFIAWGVVLLSLGLEWFYRNSIGLLTATTVGFLSLLISHKLSLDGDTMKPLQAVLDTNFWLATHVVCVTLGYSATFLAGALGVVYVVTGVFTPALTKPVSKTLAKMIYGIVCFAVLFSFVGTILGGIWADQSWGRFWGWDPKENGAVLIVLCNAILLHARWGGMAKERGVALLAIFGNIVTSWSWFGTNMLGVGLHSYGFMDSALMWLLIFVASQVVLIGIGSIPTSFWMSSVDEPTGKTSGRNVQAGPPTQRNVAAV